MTSVPDDLATVGGKALNLGRMLRADLPVPPGFCVTTPAYRRVVGDRLAESIVALTGPSSTAGDQRPEQLRRIVLAAPVPDDLAGAIAARYRALGDDVPVAVRSSATAEDLPGASFAGQQDTYLNVVGTDAVLDATRRCWASLWTERAVSYRTTQGIDHAEVSLAVVVQRMVDADVAGVMFTANPVTGNRRQLVVDASPGLGESVVSGSVNPDRFVLDAGTGAAVEVTVGDKRTAVRSVAGGGTRTVDTEASAEPCLTTAQLHSLTALAAAVTAVYDDPQDTEWAIDADGVAWLTQARSITTLYPVPVSPLPPAAPARRRPGLPLRQPGSGPDPADHPDGPGRVPADRHLRRHGGRPPARRPVSRSVGFRGSRSAGLRGHHPGPAPPAGPPGRRPGGGGDGGAHQGGAAAPRGRPAFRTRRTTTGRAWPVLARVFAHTRAPLRLVHALISPSSAHRRVDRIERAVHDRWRIPASATPTDRLDAVEERLGTDTFLVMPSVFPYAAAGLMSIAVAQRLAPADLGSWSPIESSCRASRIPEAPPLNTLGSLESPRYWTDWPRLARKSFRLANV